MFWCSLSNRNLNYIAPPIVSRSFSSGLAALHEVEQPKLQPETPHKCSCSVFCSWHKQYSVEQPSSRFISESPLPLSCKHEKSGSESYRERQEMGHPKETNQPNQHKGGLIAGRLSPPVHSPLRLMTTLQDHQSPPYLFPAHLPITITPTILTQLSPLRGSKTKRRRGMVLSHF